MFYWQLHNAMVAASGGFLAGYSLGWTGTTQTNILSGGLGILMSEYQFSWIGSCLALGAAAFCVPAGLLTNAFGRQKVLILLTVIIIIGWMSILYVGYVWIVYLARLCQGAAIGGYCVVSPLYIGEIAEKNVRGRFGAAFQLMITTGILVTYVIGAYLSVHVSCYIATAIVILYIVLVILMPESPYYLLKKDKEEKALNVLVKVRAADHNVNEEMVEIKRTVAKNDETGSIGAALKRRATIKALIMGLGLMFFQQMCGINAVIFYCSDIFRLAKSNLQPDTATIIIGVVQVVATVISVLLVDLLGRRLLLCISGSLMAVSTASLSFYFFMLDKQSSIVNAMGWLPLTSLCLFIVMFSLGFGPVPWLMMGELFADDVKGVAAAIAATLNWSLAFVVSKTYVNLKNAIGTGPTFIIYTISSTLSIIFVVFVVVETKNKSLNEIQEELEK